VLVAAVSCPLSQTLDDESRDVQIRPVVTADSNLMSQTLDDESRDVQIRPVVTADSNHMSQTLDDESRDVQIRPVVTPTAIVAKASSSTEMQLMGNPGKLNSCYPY